MTCLLVYMEAKEHDEDKFVNAYGVNILSMTCLLMRMQLIERDNDKCVDAHGS